MEESSENVLRPEVAEWAGLAEQDRTNGETEQTVETISEGDFERSGDAGERISEETFRKMGEAAGKAVDLEALAKEVEEKTVDEEDPNAGYEILAEGREELAREAEG